MVALLQTCTAFTLNVDAWSSRRQRGYLGITVHFIDSDWKLRHLLLGCPLFTGSHTAEAILELVILAVNEVGIRDKIYFVGTDNGANVVAAFDGWMPGFIEGKQLVESDDENEEEDDFDQEDRVCADDLVFDDERTAELGQLIQQEFPQASLALSDRSISVWNRSDRSFVCLID